MDHSFLSFLTTVVAIGLAFSVPAMTIMYVRSLTRARKDPLLLPELDELHARMDEMEGLKERVLELEDRLEFAERLLEQQRDPQRLAEQEHLTPV